MQNKKVDRFNTNKNGKKKQNLRKREEINKNGNTKNKEKTRY